MSSAEEILGGVRELLAAKETEKAKRDNNQIHQNKRLAEEGEVQELLAAKETEKAKRDNNQIHQNKRLAEE